MNSHAKYEFFYVQETLNRTKIGYKIKKSYKVLKIWIFIMKLLIVNLVVYCPTNLTLNDMHMTSLMR